MTDFSDLRESAEALLAGSPIERRSIAHLLYQLIVRLDEQARAERPVTRPNRRPLCSKCGLEDGACICAHLPRTDSSHVGKTQP
jgi:hypothetical protein